MIAQCAPPMKFGLEPPLVVIKVKVLRLVGTAVILQSLTSFILQHSLTLTNSLNKVKRNRPTWVLGPSAKEKLKLEFQFI